MRIVFAGTPETAIPSLNALVESGHEIVLVITRTDSPVGRKRIRTPSPVAVRAGELGLPIMKANTLDALVTSTIQELAPELGVIVAYGAFVQEPLLSLPTHGWLNLHFSTLPKWRGAAPVQRALMAGERRLGVTVFRLETGMDSGPILASSACSCERVISAGEALDTLATSGAALLSESVHSLETGSATFVPQQGDHSLAPKLSREDGLIHWDVARDSIVDRWAGVTPEPGAFSVVDGLAVKILAIDVPDSPADADSSDIPPPGEARLSAAGVLVGTGTTPLVLRTVQPAGKNAMDARDWLRGCGGSAQFE